MASAKARYFAAAHAVQSGVAMEMNFNSDPTSPKHLRVGVNTSKVDQSALVKLLINKGIFTEIEYEEALADAMEAEKRRYEIYLGEILNRKVTLG